MYVHLYSRGEDFFKEKITVDEAFQLLELQQTTEEEEDNFIGFTHPSSEDALIQFVRMKKDDWIFDIPMYKDGDYLASLISEIDHSTTLMVTMEFFHNTPLQKSIIDQDYDEFQMICKKRWQIAFNTISEDGEIIA